MKPILFNTGMVQAILDGRKTQARRVATGMPNRSSSLSLKPMRSRYNVGDVLWVKEPWRFVGWPSCDDHEYWIQSRDGKTMKLVFEEDEEFDADHRYWQECTDDLRAAGWPYDDDNHVFYTPTPDRDWDQDCPTRWRSAMSMPKVAARLFLRVTGVRCERLQDITMDDCFAEGVEHNKLANSLMNQDLYYKKQFTALWDKIHGGKHPWKSNPWVWVYGLERCEKPEKP